MLTKLTKPSRILPTAPPNPVPTLLVAICTYLNVEVNLAPSEVWGKVPEIRQPWLTFADLLEKESFFQIEWEFKFMRARRIPHEGFGFVRLLRDYLF